MPDRLDRESIADATNPVGMDGIEFIEFSTAKPQAFGQVREMMGFRPVARHRSREVLLYRQGEMNIIINAHAGGLPRTVQKMVDDGWLPRFLTPASAVASTRR